MGVCDSEGTPSAGRDTRRKAAAPLVTRHRITHLPHLPQLPIVPPGRDGCAPDAPTTARSVDGAPRGRCSPWNSPRPGPSPVSRCGHRQTRPVSQTDTHVPYWHKYGSFQNTHSPIGAVFAPFRLARFVLLQRGVPDALLPPTSPRKPMPVVAPALLSLSLLSTAPWSGVTPAPMPSAAAPRASGRPVASMIRTSAIVPPDAVIIRRPVVAGPPTSSTVVVPRWPRSSSTAPLRLATPGRTPVHDLYGVAAPHTVDALPAVR